MAPPVLLMKVRRMAMVPKFELFAGSGVVSRNRFGETVADTIGSISWAPTCENFFKLGLATFSGPGAPSLGAAVDPTGVDGVVETTVKSAALSLPSVGVGTSLLTRVNSRTKLYSVVLPAAGGAGVPSSNRSQMPPVLEPNPTASSLLAVEIESGSLVEKIPTLKSLSISAEKVELPAA